MTSSFHLFHFFRSFSWAPAKLCALQVNGWTKTLRLSPSFKVLRHSYCSNEAPLTACDDEREKCDDEREKSLAIAKLFYEACKLEGVMEIPNRLSDEQWQELSSRKTITSSRKYLKYLFLNEMRKNKLKEKRIKKRDISDKQQRKIVTEKHISAEEKQLVYGLWHNCFLNKVTSRRIRAASDEKLMRAKLFGQPIVFDGTFASHMSGKEAKNAANQFNLGYRINKSNRDPYDIYLCNFNLDDDFNKPLLKIVPKIMDERFPAEVLKDNYLKIFDKERLVYLSPHADGDLEEYDHDAVYIIGYLVDLGYNEPLSLAKAKQEGIKMKKFPLEK